MGYFKQCSNRQCTIFNRGNLITILHNNLQKAQEDMKKQADAHKTDYEFEPNDWVYLSYSHLDKTQ